MKNENEKYVVLTEKQIVQKMAGYKSAYTKLIKSAKTAKERKHLEDTREDYLGVIERAIRNENKKAIQRRAGHLSWITRRENQNSVKTIEKKEVKTATSTKKTSCKKVCKCSVSNKKR